MFGSGLLASRLAHRGAAITARRTLNSFQTGGMIGPKFIVNNVPNFLRMSPVVGRPLAALYPKRLMSWPYRFVITSAVIGMVLVFVGMTQGEEQLNAAFGVDWNWTVVGLLFFFKPVMYLGGLALNAW